MDTNAAIVPQKLRLTVAQIKALQAKHDIPNLLQPAGGKVADAQILADIYYEGSRKWVTPPSREEVEEMEVRELSKALRDYYGSLTESQVESTEGKS